MNKQPRKQNHSFGKLETFEPEDKSYSKHKLQEGQGDSTPNEGSVCSLIIYTIEEELPFTEEALCEYKINEECEITVGEGDSQIAQLFDKIVMTMQEDEIAYIKSKVDLNGNKLSETEAAVKTSGLRLKFHLKSLNRAASVDDLEGDEKLERGQHHKDKGTELFQKGNIDFALLRYERALTYVHSMEPLGDLPGDLPERFMKLKLHCHSNLAAAHLKKGNYPQVIEFCAEALKTDPKNVKALYRRSQAHLKLHKYPEAQQDLNLAKSIEPENKAVLSALHETQKLMAQEKQMEKPVKQHLKNVYSVFSMALLAAAAGAYVHLYTRILQAGLLTLIGSIVVLIMLGTTPHSPQNTKKRVGYFLGFAALAGVSLGPLLDAVIQINPSIIPTAFLGTAMIFICFSLASLMTNQKTFLYLGGFLFSGLSLLTLLSLLNLFFGSRLIYDINLYGGFLLFCGFVLFDTQMIIEKRRMGDTDFIWHCMDLFVDFVAIFRRLLIILAEKDRKKSRD